MVYVLGGKGELAPGLEASGVAVYTLWGAKLLSRMPRVVRRLLGLPLTFATLLKVVFRLRPQVIHMYLPAAYLVGGAAALVGRVPIRVMSRRSRNHYQARHPFAACAERWLHHKMTALLGNSLLVVADLLEEGADKAKIRLLYNGIPLSGAAPSSSTSRLRAELGIAPDALVMTITANLIPYKGHADLIDALAAVKDDMPPQWVLLCIGDDRGVGKQLDRRAREGGVSDHIRWIGSRRDVDRILAESDMGILCSHEEGFSNAVLEYMAAGLPAVVTDVGGNAEAVVDNVCGLVVPPRDPDSLGMALRRLGNDTALRLAMGGAAQERVRRHFDIDVCVEKYVLLYAALAQGLPLPDLDTNLLAGDATAPAR